MAKAEQGPRERMIVSTALLVRERGARATSIDAVLEHSGAPRGSVYHHFPGGREQLLREATDYAGEYVARRLERTAAEDPLGAIDLLFDEYRANLIATDFRAGCPIVAVAIESGEDGPDLRDAVVGVFDRWRRILARGFSARGIDTARSNELALQAVAGFEGALVLSRAYRDPGPLDSLRREVRKWVEAECATAEAK
jgi:AcrR family transcriptional regulator